MRNDPDYVLDKLDWMRREGIWPNGQRYLWTDAFGVLLLVSLHRELGDERWLDQARLLVGEVERVLGRERGLRIGEAPDREGQYFHYLMMWVYALTSLGEVDAVYHDKAVALVRDIHEAFVLPGNGVIWKMREDLSGPAPGYGLGALDAFHGYVVYRLLDPDALAVEIAELEGLVQSSAPNLTIEQDLGLGMMLWMSHFFGFERWAHGQRERCLQMLDTMWIDPPGYFCRHPQARNTRFAFTNFGVAIGLQAVDAWPERVDALLDTFETWRSGDDYDREAITWVMACCAHMPGVLINPLNEAHTRARQSDVSDVVEPANADVAAERGGGGR